MNNERVEPKTVNGLPKKGNTATPLTLITAIHPKIHCLFTIA